jgi:hypothetical protein
MRSRAIRQAITIAGLCTVAGCQQAPVYTGPGEQGSVPPPYSNSDFSAEQSDTWRVALPETLSCGNEYFIDVDTRQTTLCQGYNYTTLYNRTNQTLDTKVAAVSCPADNSCPQKHSWVVERMWGCKGADLTGTASVFIERGVKCLPAGAPAVPPGLQGTPTAADLRRPAIQPEPPGPLPIPPYVPPDEPNLSKASESSIQVIGDLVEAEQPQQGCPSNNRFDLTVRDRVVACASILNYEPYVTRARQSAQQLHDAARCADTCTKSEPMNVLRTTWRCDDGSGVATGAVVTTFQLAVDCKR